MSDFTLTYNDSYSETKITFEFAEINLYDVVEKMQAFLVASGYSFDGQRLEVVSDEDEEDFTLENVKPEEQDDFWPPFGVHGHVHPQTDEEGTEDLAQWFKEKDTKQEHSEAYYDTDRNK